MKELQLENCFEIEQYNSCDSCNLPECKLIQICLQYFTNILLNNYSKVKNNDLRENENMKKQKTKKEMAEKDKAKGEGRKINKLKGSCNK